MVRESKSEERLGRAVFAAAGAGEAKDIRSWRRLHHNTASAKREGRRRTIKFKPAPSDDRPFSAEAGTAEVASQEGEIFAFLQVSTLIRVVEIGEVCNWKGTLGKRLWL